MEHNDRRKERGGDVEEERYGLKGHNDRQKEQGGDIGEEAKGTVETYWWIKADEVTLGRWLKGRVRPTGGQKAMG